MDYLPVFLNVAQCPAVVVGGGTRAAAKVRLLVAAGAEVSVVAPRACEEIAALAATGAIRHAARPFAPADSDGARVVFAASGKADVDAAAAAAARARGIPVNIVDGPGDGVGSTFIMPAIVDRDAVIVAVSSGGRFPGLVREVRTRIEALLPARLGAIARFAERFRATVHAVIGEEAARRRLWQQVLDGPVARAIMRDDDGAAGEAMLALLNGRGASRAGSGAVYLVGAGPGDPDLLTLRALRVLQRADVVIYDRLVGSGVLDLARREAERIHAGKAPGEPGPGQDAINATMAAAARAGKTVVRLKGGDPFVFGRGGEEAEYLRTRGVAVEVVPGVTAAAGCAAAAGIPLTHRDYAHGVTFISGHAPDGGTAPHWRSLVHSGHTIVAYMASANARQLAARLIGHGLPPSTPVAIVENGTRPDQRVFTGVLGGLGPLAAMHRVSPPALIVIGEVVRASAAWADAESAGAVAV